MVGLMNKQKLDLREGRGKVSAQLVYVEDFQQYYTSMVCVKLEVDAYATLTAALSVADADAAAAWSAWARALLLPQMVR